MGSQQLHRMQVGSRLERAKAVKWMCRTLAPETTVPARTSTAWCRRMTCSPCPLEQQVHQGQLGQGWGGFFSHSAGPRALSTCSLGTSGKESGPSNPPCARNKVLWNPAQVSASPPLGQEVGMQCSEQNTPPLTSVSGTPGPWIPSFSRSMATWSLHLGVPSSPPSPHPPPS